MNKKLDIIELDLGMEITDLEKPTISQKTQEKIHTIIDYAKQEQKSLQQIKSKIDDKLIEECFKILLKAHTDHKEISSEELLKTAQSKNLSSLIARINHFIKRRGGLWEIKRKRHKGQNLYSLTPS